MFMTCPDCGRSWAVDGSGRGGVKCPYCTLVPRLWLIGLALGAVAVVVTWLWHPDRLKAVCTALIGVVFIGYGIQILIKGEEKRFLFPRTGIDARLSGAMKILMGVALLSMAWMFPEGWR